MNGIFSYAAAVTVVLITVAWFSLRGQKSNINKSSQELRMTMAEASAIRDELERVMENSIQISKLIVDNLDTKLTYVNEKEMPQPEKTPVTDYSVYVEDMVESDSTTDITRVKVYEVARELNMNSRKLIVVLQEMGYKVSHHMNLLDNDAVKQVKAHLLLEQSQLVSETKENPQEFTEEALILTDGESGLNKNRNAPGQRVLHTIPAEEHEVIDLGTRLPSENKAPQLSLEDIKTAHPYIAVRTLAEQGYSVREIAKLLDRGQGEINLILNLAQKKQAI